MKKRATIRQELGITQEEMAILLNMKRSHMAMYESGERELPSSALTMLHEIQLKLLSPNSAVLKSELPTKVAPEKQQQLLTQLLQENQFQQMKLTRDISALEEKQQFYSNALHLAKCLTESPQLKNLAFPGILEIIKIRARQGLNSRRATTLYALNLKLELLLHEEIWLNEALKKKT